VLWLGLAGVALAFFYHAPPLKLSYRGLGEAEVALCYGPLIASGTFLVQRGSIPADVVTLSLHRRVSVDQPGRKSKPS